MENNKIAMEIGFIGTSRLGAVVLEYLCQKGFKPSFVLTSPDKTGDRGLVYFSPVKASARSFKIPVLQFEDLKNFKARTAGYNPGLIITAGYGRILPEEILEGPRFGCLNVHPSLLPKYRGPSPVRQAILNGDKETGATIILMDGKIDHGPILVRKKTAIGPNENAQDLLERLAFLGAEILVQTIPAWVKGQIKLYPQKEKDASYTKIIKKEDGRIDWKKEASRIEREIRAFYPWPGSFTFWGEKRLKILGAGAENEQTKAVPGKVLLSGQYLCVQTKKGLLALHRLQLEGKKPADAEDFLRGYSNFIGTVLK